MKSILENILYGYMYIVHKYLSIIKIHKSHATLALFLWYLEMLK